MKAGVLQLQNNPRSQQLQKSLHSNEDPPQSKQNKNKTPHKSINQLKKKKKGKEDRSISKTQSWGQLPWRELGETGKGFGSKEVTWKRSSGFARLQRW